MIIEHKHSKHQHNVLIKTENGQLLAVITDRFSHGSQKDWRIFTADDTQISSDIKAQFNDATPLETIIQRTQDRIKSFPNQPHSAYIVKLKSDYGLTLYYDEDAQSGGYPVTATRISRAIAMNLEKANLVAKGIRDGSIKMYSGYHDDFITDVTICSLIANPVDGEF